MAKITVKGKPGGGGEWQPIPAGTVDFQIDGTTQGTTSNNNPNLKLEMQVIGNHPNVGKKANEFVVMSHKTLWRVKEILDACEVPYNEVTLEEVDEDSGEPLTEIEFDDEDLIGRQFTCDVTIRLDDKGREQNDFRNHRKRGTSVMTRAEREAAAAAREEAKPAAKPAAAPARTQQQPAARQPQQQAARQPAAQTGNQQRRSRA